MHPTSLSPQIKSLCPSIVLEHLLCDLTITPTPPALLAEINDHCTRIASTMTNESVAAMPTIATARSAYRALGKDPARYRPSAEALLRRVVSGKGLYQVNNAVDLLNLVSITTGFSIGGYDEPQVNGKVEMSIGTANDVYEGIGRGILNVEGLPMLRDETGPFGSPTSDSLRTSVKETTKRFWMVFFSFGGEAGLDEALERSQELLKKYAEGSNFLRWRTA